MFEILFAIFMALSCPAHNSNNNHNQNGQVTALDTGGDGSHIPPPPPPPIR